MHWHPESRQGAHPGLWGCGALSVPKEGEERRCCGFGTLLFSVCTFDTVGGVVNAHKKGGPGSRTDWSPILVHSSGIMQGFWGGWVRAPRLLCGLQPVIHPSHLTSGWAAAPSPCSCPLAPSLAHCFCLPHSPHPSPCPVLSVTALSSGRAQENSACLAQG